MVLVHAARVQTFVVHRLVNHDLSRAGRVRHIKWTIGGAAYRPAGPPENIDVAETEPPVGRPKFVWTLTVKSVCNPAPSNRRLRGGSPVPRMVSAVDQLSRLFPYVWRYRTKVYLSVAFAIVVAALWTATLSLTFLVVKVLLQGQSLNDYVETEIRAAQTAIEEYEQDLEKAVSLKKQDIARLKLSSASRRLVALKWAQSRFIGCRIMRNKARFIVPSLFQFTWFMTPLDRAPAA